MFWMGLGSLFWFLVLGLAIWLLIRWLSGRTTFGVSHAPSPPPSPLPALEILRQRYARGEIDTATFENMPERLEASSAREEPPVPLQG